MPSAKYLLPWNSGLPSGELSRCSVECIVVLGGMEDARVRPARHAYAIDEAAKRLTEAAALGRRSPESKQLNPLSDATTSPGMPALDGAMQFNPNARIALGKMGSVSIKVMATRDRDDVCSARRE